MMATQLTRVAIIDDDASVRKALTNLLRARGMDARTYASGHDFLAALRHGRPHCLIVDVNMPEMTGLELLRELVRRGQWIPAVVITGKYDESIRDDCRAVGAIACLQKPVNPDRLLAVLDSCLGTFSAPSLAAGGG